MTLKIRYRWNGKNLSRRQFGRKSIRGVRPGPAMVATAYSKPLESVALACHPDQVQEFNAAYARAGITGARHLPDGTCEMDGRKARNQVLKFRNLRDNDAGYGDYAGKH